MNGKFIIYALLVSFMFTISTWGKLNLPADQSSSSSHSGSSWSSNTGSGSWGGGGGSGHK